MAYPISDVPRRIVYSGSAGVGPYAFTFEVLANTDIAVYKNSTLLTLTTDYTVSINTGTGTGTVTLVVAATASDTVTIVGDRAIRRTSDFVTGGDLFANTLNEELDAQTIYTQQVDEKADRAIKIPVTDPTNLSMTLPSQASRAQKLLGFNASGEPTAYVATTTVSDTSLINFTQAGTGAVTRTAQAKMRDVVSVKDFGAVGNGVADDTAAIQAAIDYAYSLFIGNVTSVAGFTFRKGAATVYFPPGQYLTSATIEFKEGITLQGSGRWSTVIKSSYNGTLIRNATPVAYNTSGMGIKDLCVQGDRTKASQIGIALLRDFEGTYSNVAVVECGSHGWRLYECLGGQYQNIEALRCVGHGLYVTDGIASWASPTPTDLPTNNATFYDYHAANNDGAGIYLGRIGTGNAVAGCRFLGGACEYNYLASASGVGYNIEIVDTASPVPNAFYGFWCEDNKVLAHVNINMSDPTDTVRFLDFKHLGNGAANYPQKAIIVTRGRLLLDSPVGSGTLYRTYLGSNAPFQLTKATASIWGNDIIGSSLTVAQPQIVDETGASTGLYNNIRILNYGESWGGGNNTTIDFGINGPSVYQGGQSYPFAEFSNFYKGMGFGDGTAAVDAYITRSSANTLAPRSGDFLDAGSVWNGSHLKMGGYRLWVDGSGRLRIKFGAPSSDTDGTVVGTQT